MNAFVLVFLNITFCSAGVSWIRFRFRKLFISLEVMLSGAERLEIFLILSMRSQENPDVKHPNYTFDRLNTFLNNPTDACLEEALSTCPLSCLLIFHFILSISLPLSTKHEQFFVRL